MAVATPAPTDPNSSGNFGNMRRMAGQTPDVDSTPDSTGADSQASPQNKLENATSVLRQAEESINSIAGEFPQAAHEIREAKSAIRSVMKKIVSNPGGSPPIASRTGF